MSICLVMTLVSFLYHTRFSHWDTPNNELRENASIGCLISAPSLLPLRSFLLRRRSYAIVDYSAELSRCKGYAPCFAETPASRNK